MADSRSEAVANSAYALEEITPSDTEEQYYDGFHPEDDGNVKIKLIKDETWSTIPVRKGIPYRYAIKGVHTDSAVTLFGLKIKESK